MNVERYLPRKRYDVRSIAFAYGAKNAVPSGRDVWFQFTREDMAREFFAHIRSLGFWSGGYFKGNYAHTWEVRVRVA